MNIIKTTLLALALTLAIVLLYPFTLAVRLVIFSPIAAFADASGILVKLLVRKHKEVSNG